MQNISSNLNIILTLTIITNSPLNLLLLDSQFILNFDHKTNYNHNPNTITQNLNTEAEVNLNINLALALLLNLILLETQNIISTVTLIQT